MPGIFWGRVTQSHWGLRYSAQWERKTWEPRKVYGHKWAQTAKLGLTAQAGSTRGDGRQKSRCLSSHIDLGTMDQRKKRAVTPSRLAPLEATVCVEDDRRK